MLPAVTLVVGAPGRLFDGSRRKTCASSVRLRTQAEIASLPPVLPRLISASVSRPLKRSEASFLVANWSNAWVDWL